MSLELCNIFWPITPVLSNNKLNRVDSDRSRIYLVSRSYFGLLGNPWKWPRKPKLKTAIKYIIIQECIHC